jgi:hypothetical protein
MLISRIRRLWLLTQEATSQNLKHLDTIINKAYHQPSTVCSPSTSNMRLWCNCGYCEGAREAREVDASRALYAIKTLWPNTSELAAKDADQQQPFTTSGLCGPTPLGLVLEPQTPRSARSITLRPEPTLASLTTMPPKPRMASSEISLNTIPPPMSSHRLPAVTLYSAPSHSGATSSAAHRKRSVSLEPAKTH